MSHKKTIAAIALACVLAIAPAAWAQSAPTRSPDVVFVPTPQEVVDAMLSLAQVGKGDTVYDLGCGDGRIVITAAKKFGANAVGIDIDPERIQEANANARREGVTGKVSFRQEDLFQADIKSASVVTLYLLSTLNQKLKPKLLAELKPGTRIVSHAFDMGDWKPEKESDVNGRRIYLWRVPAKTASAR
ncbi:MAG TPA: class I SAM-dependent methyltransferase [Bryobacteraceae bacterium]|nr:class I SAM-dependent methyltransferase [Bryobacteraceae bacterium]